MKKANLKQSTHHQTRKLFKSLKRKLPNMTVEKLETQYCSRCKKKEVTENYKRRASGWEYSRNYAKEHPAAKREIVQHWSSRNSERKRAYRQERVDCPIYKGIMPQIFGNIKQHEQEIRLSILIHGIIFNMTCIFSSFCSGGKMGKLVLLEF